jgi:hypothetical protein
VAESFVGGRYEKKAIAYVSCECVCMYICVYTHTHTHIYMNYLRLLGSLLGGL